MTTTALKRRLYPEVNAGGFSRVDGTIQFYQRVNALLRPEMRVLDFGAGRGTRFINDDCIYRKSLANLRGRCRELVGVDVINEVLDNDYIDKGVIIKPDVDLPFESRSFDLILSDYVFEHISNPAHVSEELYRILRPGGWICVRTPNRWSLISLGARLIPSSLQSSILKRLQPTRCEVDVFPTRFLLNTAGAFVKYFSVARFEHYIYYWEAEPDYVGGSILLARLFQTIYACSPSSLSSNIFAFLRKAQ
jgi:SAM-dependent methyltransferase